MHAFGLGPVLCHQNFEDDRVIWFAFAYKFQMGVKIVEACMGHCRDRFRSKNPYHIAICSGARYFFPLFPSVPTMRLAASFSGENHFFEHMVSRYRSIFRRLIFRSRKRQAIRHRRAVGSIYRKRFFCWMLPLLRLQLSRRSRSLQWDGDPFISDSSVFHSLLLGRGVPAGSWNLCAISRNLSVD